MLPVNRNEQIDSRSTQNMRLKDFVSIKEMMDTSEILKRAEQDRRPKRGGIKYGLVQMVMLMIYIEVNRKTFDGAIITLKDSDIMYLEAMGMPSDADGRYRCPSKSMISDFINHVWPTISSGLQEEMRQIFIERSDERFWTCDSTPLEASRYNRACKYNGHYEIRMDKCHIIMMNGHPMWYTFTDGLAGDNPELLTMLSSMENGIGGSGGFATDGAYDSFETYAKVYERFGVVMASNCGCDGIFHDDVTWEYLLQTYSKLWRRHGYVAAKYTTPDRIMRFLIKNGKKRLAGKFLRNLDIRRGKRLKDSFSLARHVCEAVHKAAKRWLNFDVRGLRRKGVEQRISFRFFAIQIFSSIFADYEY